jgi:ABC-type phosphonate transport system ATPase subunit
MEEPTSGIDLSPVMDLITSAQGQVIAVGLAALTVYFSIKTIRWFRSAA